MYGVSKKKSIRDSNYVYIDTNLAWYSPKPFVTKLWNIMFLVKNGDGRIAQASIKAVELNTICMLRIVEGLDKKGPENLRGLRK